MKQEYKKMLENIYMKDELINTTKDKMYIALGRKSASKTKIRIISGAIAASLALFVCGTIYNSKNTQSDSGIYSEIDNIAGNENQYLLNVYTFDSEANKLPINSTSFNTTNNEDKPGMVYMESIDGNKTKLTLVTPLQIQYSGENIDKIIIQINSGNLLYPETPLTNIMLIRRQEVAEFDNAVKTAKNIGKQLTIDSANETSGDLSVIWQSDTITVDNSEIEGYIGAHTFDFGVDLNISAAAYFKDGTTEEKEFTMDVSRDELSY